MILKPIKRCSIEGCERRYNARNFCNYHYSKAQKEGIIPSRVCKIEGCINHIVSHDLCATHCKQLWITSNREKNNSRMRAYLKTWRIEKEDKAKLLARGDRHRKNNLEKFALKEKLRRSKKRANGGQFSSKDWFRLYHRFNKLCAYCGSRPATTIDHVIPVAKGGSGYIGNILPACVTCNSSKQDKTLYEWRINHGR